MSKLKTRKSAAKRFERMKYGGFKRKKAFHSHLLGNKAKKRKNNLSKMGVVSKADLPAVRRMVPFKGK